MEADLCAAWRCWRSPRRPHAAPADSAEGRLLHDLFKTIVEMPTVKGRGQVPKMARALSAKLRQAGFAAQDIEIVPVGETAAMIVRYRGTGAKPPLLFLAHMDVVEAKRADWERDPFKLYEADGFLYGRGTSDNKLGVAHLVAAFISLKKQGFKPDRDLILGFSGDEETDMASSRVLAERLAAVKPDYAINSDSGGGRADASGKPISFAVQVAEKTFANIEVTIRNPGGHSARPRADNAIYELAELLGKVRGYSFPLVDSDLTRANAARRRGLGEREREPQGQGRRTGGARRATRRCWRRSGASRGWAMRCGRPAFRRCWRAGMPTMPCRKARRRRSIAGSSRASRSRR